MGLNDSIVWKQKAQKNSKLNTITNSIVTVEFKRSKNASLNLIDDCRVDLSGVIFESRFSNKMISFPNLFSLILTKF